LSQPWVSLRGGGRASRTLMPARRRLPFSRRWPLPMGDPSMCARCGLVQTGSNRRLPRCGRGALPLSYGPMTAARVMPCCGGGARSTTRPPNRVIAAKQMARAEGLEPPTKPGVGSRRSAAELRACGTHSARLAARFGSTSRRDRDRTDGAPVLQDRRSTLPELLANS